LQRVLVSERARRYRGDCPLLILLLLLPAAGLADAGEIGTSIHAVQAAGGGHSVPVADEPALPLNGLLADMALAGLFDPFALDAFAFDHQTEPRSASCRSD
jgi:hypothetical protein